MSPRQRESEESRLEASHMRIKKRIEKEKIIFRYWWGNILKVLTGKVSKIYKVKIQIQNDQILFMRIHN